MRLEASTFNRAHKGKPIVVVGESYSLRQLDLSHLSQFVTVSCNRILLHDSFRPTYLIQSDREPYTQERDEGRLQNYAMLGGHLLLSETIFDPKVIGRRADGKTERQLGAQPQPDFDWYACRVGAWHTDCNFKTFTEYLCSCANICGPMIQAAAILGASKIGVVGVDMAWQKHGASHHWGQGKTRGAYPPRSLTMILRSLANMRDELEKRGIKVWNLSPIRRTPFSTVFGNHGYSEFLQTP